MFCELCGILGPKEDEEECGDLIHKSTIKHICNQILYEYKQEKSTFSKNRESIFIYGGGKITSPDGKTIADPVMTDHFKIRIYMKPNHEVKFTFDIRNECIKDDIYIVGIHLAHPQPQFIVSEHPYIFGEPPNLWKQREMKEIVTVRFSATDIGQYEMPIIFTFVKKSTNRNIIFIREMVVMVEENPTYHQFIKTPYLNRGLRAKHIIPSLGEADPKRYKVPPMLKILLPRGLEEKALEGINRSPEMIEQLRRVLQSTRCIFDQGIVQHNYLAYFHHLLWWEELVVKISLKKYNMSSVKVELKDKFIVLEVPGLAEKRPSLLRGDRVFLQNHKQPEMLFECVIKNIDDNYVHLGDIDQRFFDNYTPDVLFDVRFIMSRVTMERSHEALTRLFAANQECRVFPQARVGAVYVPPIPKFFNNLIATNREQRSAVEHIVAGTSGKAPYIVFGPPGTGKTMTIVEAIIQIVMRNNRHRVLVCTDSNMAADHIALMLLRYSRMLNIKNFLIRANSRSRDWGSMPAELANISNGTSFETFNSLCNAYVSTFHVVVTTLMHSAKYASVRSQRFTKLQMTHLFIDEAGQASEPHALVPLAGLLAPNGRFVLAGDPKQLGPVCLSKDASRRGLGQSLLERLIQTDLYNQKNPDYITMLVKNFRSHPDILNIPNRMFYGGELEALVPNDPISTLSILGNGGNRATVFHAVNSKEQRMGNAPSFFNEKELEMVKRYVKALMEVHRVHPEDVGVITPYIRQVYKIKAWLHGRGYNKIEVGTVEAFQGKEKRVILISTVRANCRLLDYDALYSLGFLVDDKRFNVALTRAKSKLVIIGNPTCLINDIKWCVYMKQCKEFGSYLGEENQQLERTELLLDEIARKRFLKCGLTEALEDRKKIRELKKSFKMMTRSQPQQQ